MGQPDHSSSSLGMCDASSNVFHLIWMLSILQWGIMGHYLRVRIHHHILKYGNLTKKKKVNVAGESA